MESPAVQNAYNQIQGHNDVGNTDYSSGNLGSSAPTQNTSDNYNTLLQNEQSIYNFAISHEHDHFNAGDGQWTHCNTINQTMVSLANDAQEAISDLKENSADASGNTAQDALQIDQNNFNAEMCDANIVGIISQNLIDGLQGAINWNVNHEHYETTHWSWGACGTTTIEHTHMSMVQNVNNDEGLINDLTSERASIEKNMEALDPSNTLKNLIATLNGLAGGNASSTATNDSSNPSYLDYSDATVAINDLMDMIKQQIEIDNNLEYSNGSTDPKTLTALQELQIENNQSSTLNSLSQLLTGAATTQHGVVESDRAATYNQSALELAVGSLGWNSSNITHFNEEQKLAAAKRLYQAIENAQNDLTQVSADMAMRAFKSISLEMNNIMSEVQKVLADVHLSPKEKEVALAKLMQLMLGFLQTFIQIAQNLRNQSKQKIEQANISAQKKNLQSIKADGQILHKVQEQQHTLSILHDVMIGVEVLATIAFAVTGTIGVAIVMFAMTVMDVTKETTKLTNDLAQKEGSQLGASATMTGIAIAATMLGGAGIDMLLQRMTAVIEIAVEVAERSASEAIEEAITKSTTGALSRDEAESAVNTTVKRTSELAAKNAAKQFYKNNSVAARLGNYGKTAEMQSKYIAKAVEKAIRKAVEEIAEKASSGTVITPEIINTVAEKAAIQIFKSTAKASAIEAADASNAKKFISSVKKAYNAAIEKIPENVRSGMWAGVYTAGSTNMMVDFLPTSNNATESSSKKDFQEFVNIAMEIIQMLMESIAMMKGGGFLDQMASEDPSQAVQGVMRAGAIMQTGSQAVNTGSDFQQYAIDEEKAQATKNLEMTQAFNNMLQTYSTQDKEATAQASSGLNLEEKRLAQEQLWLSSNMWDGTNAGCKVLAAQSI